MGEFLEAAFSLADFKDGGFQRVYYYDASVLAVIRDFKP